jgi:hypothetical protein
VTIVLLLFRNPHVARGYESLGEDTIGEIVVNEDMKDEIEVFHPFLSGCV